MSGIPATISADIPESFRAFDRVFNLLIIKNSLRSSTVKKVIIIEQAEEKLKLYKKIFTQKITGAANKLTVTKSMR